MPTALSASEVAAYREEGYRSPLRVFSATEAADLRASLEAAEAKAGGPLQGKWRVKTHLLCTWADRIVHHPAILDAVESLVGPDILCWTTNFFIKEPGSPGFVSWHQDATYWGLDPEEVVTAWVALSPSTPESGCMRVIPGSHGESHIPHVYTFHKDNLLTRGQEIAVAVDESRAVDIVLQPGEMSLHHVLIVHGSEPNQADYPRIGFAIRYVPTHVRQLSGLRDYASLVRGRDQFGHFLHEPAPSRDFDPAVIALHAEVYEAQMKILYAGARQMPEGIAPSGG